MYYSFVHGGCTIIRPRGFRVESTPLRTPVRVIHVHFLLVLLTSLHMDAASRTSKAKSLRRGRITASPQRRHSPRGAPDAVIRAPCPSKDYIELCRDRLPEQPACLRLLKSRAPVASDWQQAGSPPSFPHSRQRIPTGSKHPGEPAKILSLPPPAAAAAPRPIIAQSRPQPPARITIPSTARSNKSWVSP